MNKQEMFDKAVGGIIAQGRPARADKDTMCFYRTPEGLKCAAGQLIPDERYSPDIEGFGSYRDEVLEAIGIDKEDDETIHFVGELQSAHDNASLRGAEFLEYFKKYSRSIAEEHNLNTQVLDA